MSAPLMMTAKEAATALGCKVATVKRMVAAGRLRGVRFGGPRSHLRIPAAAVAALASAEGGK